MQRIDKILGEHSDLDAIVFLNGTEPCVDMGYFYVTELIEGLFEGSMAIVHSDGTREVITSLLEAESAKKGNFEVSVFKSRDEKKEIIIEKLAKFQKIGIHSEGLLHKNFLDLKGWAPNAELVDISKSLAKARMIKDDKEIETIKKACVIASEVAEKVCEFIKEGVVEYEVAAELSYMMQKMGAVGPSFDTISSFGKNTAEPHYTAGDAVLKKGEFVLLDFGAKFKRYVSDITRTFCCGEASEKQKEMYDCVLQAQKIALDMIKPGVDGQVIHKAVSDYIDGTKFKGLFTHSTGHSLGLSVHDGIALTKDMENILEENMVFTVEPGIYLPGYGGVRIEDDVRVTSDGVELLTFGTKELIEL
jgi:Xaa-Pro dipeptidase